MSLCQAKCISDNLGKYAPFSPLSASTGALERWRLTREGQVFHPVIAAGCSEFAVTVEYRVRVVGAAEVLGNLLAENLICEDGPD